METNEAYLYCFVVYDYSKNTRGSGPDKILACIVFFANIKYLDKTKTVESAIANDYYTAGYIKGPEIEVW